MGSVSVSSAELYKPGFPEERERWRRDVGLVEESAGSDCEVNADRSGSGGVETDLVDRSEGLPRGANIVNVPWGAKPSPARKQISVAVQAR